MAWGSEVRQLLETMRATSARLESLLREEPARLGAGDAADVEALSQEKADLLQAIADQEAQRQSALQAAGLEDDAQGMRAWIRSARDVSGLEALWERIVACLRRCRALNEASGTVIHQYMRRNRRLLELFQGNNAPAARGYGAQGAPAEAASGRDLGTA